MNSNVSIVKIQVAILALVYASFWASQAKAEPQAGWSGTATLGPVVFPKYVGGKGTEVWPLPILSINYDETFYVEIQRVGVYLLASDDNKIGLGLAVEPRFGFSAKDGRLLRGMSKRRDSIEGGPTFDLDFDVIAFSVAYFGDLNRSSRGSSIRASLYKPLVKDDRWEAGALLAFDAMNSRLANYFFGVRPTEATALRPAYQPGKGISTSVGLNGTYKLDKQHTLMFGAIATRLPRAVAASPIVETRQATTFYVSYGWRL